MVRQGSSCSTCGCLLPVGAHDLNANSTWKQSFSWRAIDGNLVDVEAAEECVITDTHTTRYVKRLGVLKSAI